MLCALGFAALIVVLVRVLDALQDLRAEVERPAGRDPAAPGRAAPSVDEARDDLERFDRVLGSAEAISANVQGVPGGPAGAVSTPVIKTVALAAGTSGAARRLRRKEGADEARDVVRGRGRRRRRRRGLRPAQGSRPWPSSYRR